MLKIESMLLNLEMYLWGYMLSRGKIKKAAVFWLLDSVNLNIVHLITRITISEELIHYLFIMRIVMSAELNYIYYILFSDAFQLAKQTNL